jgi:hypothetical protein
VAENGPKVVIAVSVIGLVSAVAVAVISNWEKLFPSPSPPRSISESPAPVAPSTTTIPSSTSVPPPPPSSQPADIRGTWVTTDDEAGTSICINEQNGYTFTVRSDRIQVDVGQYAWYVGSGTFTSAGAVSYSYQSVGASHAPTNRFKGTCSGMFDRLRLRLRCKDQFIMFESGEPAVFEYTLAFQGRACTLP